MENQILISHHALGRHDKNPSWTYLYVFLDPRGIPAPSVLLRPAQTNTCNIYHLLDTLGSAAETSLTHFSILADKKGLYTNF